jgi:hypothetical protein
VIAEEEAEREQYVRWLAKRELEWPLPCKIANTATYKHKENTSLIASQTSPEGELSVNTSPNQPGLTNIFAIER